MPLYILDEDQTLSPALANGGAVVTNRNAIGPLTATLPAEAVLGDAFEIHAVEAEDLTVAVPASHSFRLGATGAASVTLHGGAALVIRKTKPAVWTGLLSGEYTLNA